MIGAVGISVADACVEEGTEAVLAFAVTLSRAATSALSADYATSDRRSWPIKCARGGCGCAAARAGSRPCSSRSASTSPDGRYAAGDDVSVPERGAQTYTMTPDPGWGTAPRGMLGR